MTNVYDTYTSPLASRNASPQMLAIWSSRHKFNQWRKIWLAVAAAQHKAGLPVTAAQVAELAAAVEKPGGITDDELHRAEHYERELRHDVMAHVHALGESCPHARGIIHLGLTSQDVVCNADLNLLFEAGQLIEHKCAVAVLALLEFAERFADLPTLGFTHYQPAQPVTVGRRAAMWAHDLDLTRDNLACVLAQSVRMRGLRGATGTQAAIASLMKFEPQNAPRDVAATQLNQLSVLEDVAVQAFRADPRLGRVYEISGQTYPRVIDTFVISALASIAAVLHKIGTDIRLLCNRKELDEPFEAHQIGSSAMPYKRNPMRCERMCGLARFVMNLVGNTYDTAAVQWLERTLDDSSNRRLTLPEAFLATDGCLDIMHNVAKGLIVHEATVRNNLLAELPFMATENILMAVVSEGGDRQEYHELIRKHAQESGRRIKVQALPNDLLERLAQDPAFFGAARGGPLRCELNWTNLLDPNAYVGMSAEQTRRYVASARANLAQLYGEGLANAATATLRV